MKPQAKVLYSPGTNSHLESLDVFRRVGADAELLFTEEIARGTASLDDADLLFIPGGFSFGDHLGAGRVAGRLFGAQLSEALAARPRPVVAICNGFQIAVQCGLFGPGVDLASNVGGTFVNNPVQRHVVGDADSVWLRGLAGRTMTFPCAHAEGRFRFDDSIAADQRGWRVALTYPEGENPDGSMEDIAGIVSPDGLVLGMMDHPERSMDEDTRLAFFRNAVESLA